MTSEYLQQIYYVFRNAVLNTFGIKRNLYELINDKDIEHALDLFSNNDIEVDKAIKEYNPQTHDVMKRPNKSKKDDDAYITEKLPRAWQRYINEVELFFLLGNPIKWKKDDGDDEAYEMFQDFLKSTRFDSKIRELKRLAGSETEASLMFHIYNDGGAVRYDNFIAARSKGYFTRSMFDQYGNLVALAFGYRTKENGKLVQHWDIQTAEWLFECAKDGVGWNVAVFPNPTGKINGVYASQPKAWDVAVSRINRDEMLDSKIADTNNYFADPIAAATADVIQNLKSEERIAKMMQLTGKDSKFEYVNPPQNSEARKEEKANLKQSILYDTFTPDFSYDALKGFGTLSGAALRNAMVLGYIKRAKNLELYDELIDRYKNVCLALLKLLYPAKADAFGKLKISHEFSDPFASDGRDERASVKSLYSAGLLSLETAIGLLALVDAPQEEMDKIRRDAQKKMLEKKE